MDSEVLRANRNTWNSGVSVWGTVYVASIITHYISITCNINSIVLHIPIYIFTVYSVSIDTGLYNE